MTHSGPGNFFSDSHNDFMPNADVVSVNSAINLLT